MSDWLAYLLGVACGIGLGLWIAAEFPVKTRAISQEPRR